MVDLVVLVATGSLKYMVIKAFFGRERKMQKMCVTLEHAKFGGFTKLVPKLTELLHCTD